MGLNTIFLNAKKKNACKSVYIWRRNKLIHNIEGVDARNLVFNGNIRSKILSHFVKGKTTLIPMETILIIPGELEYLEGLVKLVGRRKDAKTIQA